jgi:hypothetical protein
MDFIRRNSETLGFAAVAAGIFLLYRRQTDNQSKLVEEDVPLRHLTHADKNKIFRTVEVKYDGENLTASTIEQTHEAILQYAMPEYIEVLERYRRERRANKKNIKVYVQLWKEFTVNVNEIFIRNSREVLKALVIPESVWESSHVNHSYQGNESLMLKKSALPQTIKDKLVVKKHLTKPEYLKILKTQLKYINEEGKYPTEIARYTVDPIHAVAVIQARVDDRIFEDFRVEEEDLAWAKIVYKDDVDVLDADSRLQLAYIRLTQP